MSTTVALREGGMCDDMCQLVCRGESLSLSYPTYRLAGGGWSSVVARLSCATNSTAIYRERKSKSSRSASPLCCPHHRIMWLSLKLTTNQHLAVGSGFTVHNEHSQFNQYKWAPFLSHTPGSMPASHPGSSLWARITCRRSGPYSCVCVFWFLKIQRSTWNNILIHDRLRFQTTLRPPGVPDSRTKRCRWLSNRKPPQFPIWRPYVCTNIRISLWWNYPISYSDTPPCPPIP